MLFLASTAHGDEVRLASASWPPYMDPSLPEGGVTTLVVKTVFAKMGKRASTDFVPWNRAVALGTQGKSHAGYFAEYASPKIMARCHLSASVGTSLVGFVERRDNSFSWSSIDDLRSKLIGVVDGYVNDGAELDAAIADGTLPVETVGTDLLNVRKVAAGRLSAAIIDANVLNYLISRDPSLARVVQMDERPLKTHELFVCFRKTPEGEALRDEFNAALAETDVDRLIADYFANHFIN